MKNRKAQGPESRIHHYWKLTTVAILLATLGTLVGCQSNAPSDLSSPISTLAVLPLHNLVDDPAQERMADGFTDSIISELANKGELKKTSSRKSVTPYKGTSKSISEIAQELEVEGLIEGSVHRDGESIRIVVHLIDGRTDTHIWSQSYEGTTDEVLSLQSDIAGIVANEIHAILNKINVPQSEDQN